MATRGESVGVVGEEREGEGKGEERRWVTVWVAQETRKGSRWWRRATAEEEEVATSDGRGGGGKRRLERRWRVRRRGVFFLRSAED